MIERPGPGTRGAPSPRATMLSASSAAANAEPTSSIGGRSPRRRLGEQLRGVGAALAAHRRGARCGGAPQRRSTCCASPPAGIIRRRTCWSRVKGGLFAPVRRHSRPLVMGVWRRTSSAGSGTMECRRRWRQECSPSVATWRHRPDPARTGDRHSETTRWANVTSHTTATIAASTHNRRREPSRTTLEST